MTTFGSWLVAAAVCGLAMRAEASSPPEQPSVPTPPLAATTGWGPSPPPVPVLLPIVPLAPITTSPPTSELSLEPGLGMFPYLGASVLTELCTGPLALGAQFSGGTTFFGGTAGEAALGIGYGLARPQLRTSVLAVAGLLSVQGVAVVADCGGLLAFSRCNSGVAATLPFVGMRANVFRARGHFLEGGVFGLDYTLNPATQAYQNCTSDFGGDSCKPSTATLTRVLLTLEFSLGTSIF